MWSDMYCMNSKMVQYNIILTIKMFFFPAFKEGDPDRLILPTDSQGN